MNVRALGCVISLVLAPACSTSGSHSRAGGSTQPPSGDAQGADTASGGAGAKAAPSGQQGAQPSDAQGGPQEQSAGAKPGPVFKDHSADQVIAGRIGDVSAESVSIQGEGGETKVLAIVPQTSITVDGEKATLDDLEEGQLVRASFSEVEGQGVAVEIHAAASEDGSSESGSTPPGSRESVPSGPPRTSGPRGFQQR